MFYCILQGRILSCAKKKTYCLKNKAYVLNLLAQETRRDGIISSIKEKTQFCPSYLATNSKIPSPFKVLNIPNYFFTFFPSILINLCVLCNFVLSLPHISRLGLTKLLDNWVRQIRPTLTHFITKLFSLPVICGEFSDTLRCSLCFCLLLSITF